MFTWFSNDVAKLVGQFEVLARKLDIAADYHRLQAEAHEKAAALKTELQKVATQDFLRAKAVAEKLRALVA